MPKTTKWSDIRKQRGLEEEAAIARERDMLVLAGVLARWRDHAGMSQTRVAEEMAVTQANISRIENEADLRLSTLASYVDALGGRLEVRAIFDEGATVLSTDQDVVVEATS